MSETIEYYFRVQGTLFKYLNWHVLRVICTPFNQDVGSLSIDFTNLQRACQDLDPADKHSWNRVGEICERLMAEYFWLNPGNGVNKGVHNWIKEPYRAELVELCTILGKVQRMMNRFIQVDNFIVSNASGRLQTFTHWPIEFWYYQNAKHYEVWTEPISNIQARYENKVLAIPPPAAAQATVVQEVVEWYDAQSYAAWSDDRVQAVLTTPMPAPPPTAAATAAADPPAPAQDAAAPAAKAASAAEEAPAATSGDEWTSEDEWLRSRAPAPMLGGQPALQPNVGSPWTKKFGLRVNIIRTQAGTEMPRYGSAHVPQNAPWLSRFGVQQATSTPWLKKFGVEEPLGSFRAYAASLPEVTAMESTQAFVAVPYKGNSCEDLDYHYRSNCDALRIGPSLAQLHQVTSLPPVFVKLSGLAERVTGREHMVTLIRRMQSDFYARTAMGRIAQHV